MTKSERGIRRQLRRSGLSAHAIPRTARRLAAQADCDTSAGTLEALISRRTWREGDPAAAHAAQQGATMGAAFALGMLDAGRWMSTGLRRLQAHVNGRDA
ncbi:MULTISPECIES: hypothetical protein [unclassified Methylobacterium]|uniref:hypothetical protein n=1 Tax=unclassified Methylobacterium TaxID=2615210 RepID=UPI0006F69BDB|nr:MULTISPECIES: hypothetical protein [unclassified Methylobacterium]KQP13489.1 hypothetical protein ASF26_19160 [Methylobacterium sp. Leaf93]